MSKSAPDKQSGTLDDTLPPGAAAPQPNASRSRTRRLKDSPLTESDWVEAATDILVRENVRGIRIDTLCQKLGVTKGSFYWHFKTRADLLAAMLKNWQRRMTLNVIQNISRTNETGFSRLRNLMALPRMPRSPAFAQVEMSIRDWGDGLICRTRRSRRLTIFAWNILPNCSGPKGFRKPKPTAVPTSPIA